MHWPFASKAEPWWPLRFLNLWPWHNRDKLNSQKEKNDSDHRTSLRADATCFIKILHYSSWGFREKEWLAHLTQLCHLVWGFPFPILIAFPFLPFSLSFQKAVLTCFFRCSRSSAFMPKRNLPEKRVLGLDGSFIHYTVISETWSLPGFYYLGNICLFSILSKDT